MKPHPRAKQLERVVRRYFEHGFSPREPMRPPTPDEHWSLYSGDARQVRATLQQYLVDCKTVVEHQLGNSSDTQEMMRLQGERRVLERLLEAFQKDPRKTSPLSRDLGGLKVTA